MFDKSVNGFALLIVVHYRMFDVCTNHIKNVMRNWTKAEIRNMR
jgi:hypothetical protein